MSATQFDTLKNARVPDGQSEAIASTIQDSLGQNVATMADNAEVKTKLVELRADIYRALWIQGGALVMIMVALFTLFRAF